MSRFVKRNDTKGYKQQVVTASRPPFKALVMHRANNSNALGAYRRFFTEWDWEAWVLAPKPLNYHLHCEHRHVCSPATYQ